MNFADSGPPYMASVGAYRVGNNSAPIGQFPVYQNQQGHHHPYYDSEFSQQHQGPPLKKLRTTFSENEIRSTYFRFQIGNVNQILHPFHKPINISEQGIIGFCPQSGTITMCKRAAQSSQFEHQAPPLKKPRIPEQPHSPYPSSYASVNSPPIAPRSDEDMRQPPPNWQRLAEGHPSPTGNCVDQNKVLSAVNGSGCNGSEDHGSLNTSTDELRVNTKPAYWKTKFCKSWETRGLCSFGVKCHFAHGQEELQMPGGQLEAEAGNSGFFPIKTHVAVNGSTPSAMRVVAIFDEGKKKGCLKCPTSSIKSMQTGFHELKLVNNLPSKSKSLSLR